MLSQSWKSDNYRGSNEEFDPISHFKDMSGKGRGLISSKELGAGEVVAAEEWLASVLHIAQVRLG